MLKGVLNFIGKNFILFYFILFYFIGKNFIYFRKIAPS